MDTKHIHIADYNYELPDNRIAKFPVPQRDHSKLLIYRSGELSDDVFYSLPQYIPSGSLMIFNNTKVIPARMYFHKASGALIEVFLLEPYAPTDYESIFHSVTSCSWTCLVGNLKKWKSGDLVRTFQARGIEVNLRATLCGSHETGIVVDFQWDSPLLTFADILDAVGSLPIPPYLNRETCAEDATTYQTVYSAIKGSVAAPTAGLHFTESVLSQLAAKNVDCEYLTLHVGAGTFRPVKSDTIEGHSMHSEHICVHRETIMKLIAHDASAIAVGTTSVRTLESLYYIGCKLIAQPNLQPELLHVEQWDPYKPSATCVKPVDALTAVVQHLDRRGEDALHATTQLLIAPGYEFKIVRMLITNFHQPQSTLLLLVSAFVKGNWKEIYDYALSHDFRFLSYGDSSLLVP